ncbi:Sodium/calcium exchanger protein-domain-containing protein [Sporodiniella umbellata]|nr:Sodium/calcium exchanger protein-domain-containing protein [Sporodiniella umbellata]
MKTQFILFLSIFPWAISASLLFPTSHHHNTCTNIDSHKDQCEFVLSTCQGFSGYFLEFYYCSTLWKPLVLTFMLSGLVVLFGTISLVAGDFFCPNLQTISSKLNLSESIAGVTVLAFGNGSPDLFSTFTAMNTGSGSLALGELIGAAFFIVSVVSGCMGIIRPFQSKEIVFRRDASFLTGAVMILTWVVYHGSIHWYHGLLLVSYYIIYVTTVLISAWGLSPLPVSKSSHSIKGILSETSKLLNSSESFSKPSQIEILPSEHLGHIIRPVSPTPSILSQKTSASRGYHTTHESIPSSFCRHPLSPRIGFRTSLFGAIDFQEQVAHLQQVNSAQHLTLPTVRYASDHSLSVPCLSKSHMTTEPFHSTETMPPVDYFTWMSSPSSPVLSVHKEELIEPVLDVLFPTLKGWSSKTRFAKINALAAFPIVFFLTLTLPVIEEVKIDQLQMPELTVNGDDPASEVLVKGVCWCRWLWMVQSIGSMTFVFSVMAFNSSFDPAYIVSGFGLGCLLALGVFRYTQRNEPPHWYWMVSFVGFVVALHWIFLLANAMVGLMQALGNIFHISEAIMGLTIFALGNSVGDFVANTAIAKMGFPTMAISACYAGPLLNMVLGIGISSTYQTWVTGKPYALDVSPTILLSSCGLITVLLSTILVTSMNGYRINKGLGWWLIAVYFTCCLFNVLLEFCLIK